MSQFVMMSKILDVKLEELIEDENRLSENK